MIAFLCPKCKTKMFEYEELKWVVHCLTIKIKCQKCKAVVKKKFGMYLNHEIEIV